MESRNLKMVRVKKPMTLCKFAFDDIPKEQHALYPFAKDDVFVYIGSISNTAGHCVVIRQRDGKAFVGFHTEDFIQLTEEEL